MTSPPSNMHDLWPMLLNHGYLIVFFWVLADQVGMPLPAFPALLAAGALAHEGKLDLFNVIALVALATLLSDTLWFEVGRRKGRPVLKFLCRAALEPDGCIRRTQTMFARRGAAWTLLVSKFVPGLNVVASPLAGVSGISQTRFLLLNAVGSILFATAVVLPGYLFSQQLERVLAVVTASGHWLVITGGALFSAYLAIKYARRARFVRFLRVARISPEELNQKIAAGEDVAIVDLRLPADFAAAPQTLPGAIRLAPEEVASRHQEIPRDREIVLYCTCPDEYTSARAALLLRHYGIHRVRPLAGGYEAWRQMNFPLVSSTGQVRSQALAPVIGAVTA